MAYKPQTKKEMTGELKTILTAMAEIAGPCGCKDIAEKTGLESKAISCQLKSLKTNGYIDSPVRCKYSITAEGKAAL